MYLCWPPCARTKVPPEFPQLAGGHDLGLAKSWQLVTLALHCSYPSPWHRIAGTRQMAQSGMENFAGKPLLVLHQQPRLPPVM